MACVTQNLLRLALHDELLESRDHSSYLLNPRHLEQSLTHARSPVKCDVNKGKKGQIPSS